MPQPEPIIEPQDVDFPGIILLEVDITDISRKIFQVRQVIPIAGAGAVTLLFPKWLPGYHSPQAPIELLSGLKIAADGQDIQWRRHPTEVNAFHIDVHEGMKTLEVTFQFLSPTDAAQGRVIVGANLLNFEWNTVVLYPAGHFARRIKYQPTLRLPHGWKFGCALEIASRDGDLITFEAVALDELVDSPLFAGRHYRLLELDEQASVRLHILADQPDLLAATDEQIEPHRQLVRQADRLFGCRHFDHFDILLALSNEVGTIGVEHHRSCEATSIPGYFTEWDTKFVRRDTIPHEYVHSWNGKYRRGEDSWTPCFQQPIRNSLMWVYEGQTQY
jgi:predicted metalloprotease with PDZ domain